MFSRKRHFYEKKTFYAALFTAFTLILSLSLWMGDESFLENEPAIPQDVSGQDQEIDTQVSSGHVGQTFGQTESTGQGAIGKGNQPGYMIIAEDQYIKVYFQEESGTKRLVRTTDISFDLLSTKDQELFRNGVLLENEDELMELLQDFES